ncbi:MAG: hypothetical protein IJO27_02870 [Bacilli bacterium]|nr:hypothetical protein [Bacilli bacterium]
MRKIILIILILFIFISISQRSNFNEKDINVISLSINDFNLKVNPSYYSEIINAIDEVNFKKVSKTLVYDDKNTITIINSDDEIVQYFLSQSGVIIQKKDNSLSVGYNGNKLKNVYESLMGKSVFLGVCEYDDNCVQNLEDDKRLFFLDSISVIDVVINKNGNYFLKKERINDFVDVLNNTRYYDKNIVYDRYGHIGGISIFFQNDILYFEFFETEANENVITLIVKDGSTVFHTDYLLSNNDFLILYKEIMGKEVFEFPSLVNPSSEWLDKMQSDLEYENYISSIRKE